MNLLDPIVPFLGPFGQVLAASDLIVVGLVLLGLVCFGLNMVKKSIFETSRAWVGATIALSVVTILFRGMDTFCGCGFYTDSNGALTQLVPFTYMLISGSFFAILFVEEVQVVHQHPTLDSSCSILESILSIGRGRVATLGLH